MVKEWSNTGQRVVEEWSKSGQRVVNEWSKSGQAPEVAAEGAVPRAEERADARVEVVAPAANSQNSKNESEMKHAKSVNNNNPQIDSR